jgi:hypothetical protein
MLFLAVIKTCKSSTQITWFSYAILRDSLCSLLPKTKYFAPGDFFDEKINVVIFTDFTHVNVILKPLNQVISNSYQ